MMKSDTAQFSLTSRSKLSTNTVARRSGLANRASRQASLNGGFTELLLPTALAARRARPNHLGIKPDQPRSAPLQAITVNRPIHGLAPRRGPTAHAFQLSCWIHTVKPSNRSV